MKSGLNLTPALFCSSNGRRLLPAATQAIVLTASVVCLALAHQLQSGLNVVMPARAADSFRYGDPEERKRNLDALFAGLKTAKSGFVAQAIIEQIWLTWHQSGRSDIDDLLSRAKINASEGEFDASLKKLDEIIERAPNFAEAWNGRATVLFQMGRYEHSLADIDETLKREPRHFGALAGRGRIHMRQGNDKAALEAFNEAVRHNPFIPERRSLIPAIRKRLGIREL